MNNNQKLIVDRRYQRASNWDDKMQKMFIDSILRGYPIPLIYLHKKNDLYYIVDGQQRLNALFAFLNNQFRLLNPVNNQSLFPKYISDEECKWSEKKV